jgi:hypothetical protein
MSQTGPQSSGSENLTRKVGIPPLNPRNVNFMQRLSKQTGMAAANNGDGAKLKKSIAKAGHREVPEDHLCLGIRVSDADPQEPTLSVYGLIPVPGDPGIYLARTSSNRSGASSVGPVHRSSASACLWILFYVHVEVCDVSRAQRIRHCNYKDERLPDRYCSVQGVS